MSGMVTGSLGRGVTRTVGNNGIIGRDPKVCGKEYGSQGRGYQRPFCLGYKKLVRRSNSEKVECSGYRPETSDLGP